MAQKPVVFCKGGGCTAKLGPGVLARVLEQIPKTQDENLLIGYDSSDDGAVYRLTEDRRLFRHWIFFRQWWMTLIPSVRLRRRML